MDTLDKIRRYMGVPNLLHGTNKIKSDDGYYEQYVPRSYRNENLPHSVTYIRMTEKQYDYLFGILNYLETKIVLPESFGLDGQQLFNLTSFLKKILTEKQYRKSERNFINTEIRRIYNCIEEEKEETMYHRTRKEVRLEQLENLSKPLNPIVKYPYHKFKY